MKIANINTNNKVFIIAEVGNNHEGSFRLAEETIYLAAQAGVDAVKFQTFQTESYINSESKDRFNLLKSFELKFHEFEKLSKIAKEEGLYFISTPFDIESALFLSEIVDVIKISSGDNTFFPLIETVAKINKPIILSTGLLDIEGIAKSKNIIDEIRRKKNILEEMALLHCVTSYPVEPKFANLKAVSSLINSFDCTVGYSDHTIGINASIAAVAMGARIIEKHFTKDKNYSDFRDHHISADLSDMKKIVNSIREVETMLGDGKKNPQLPEKEITSAVRRSIVAKHNIVKGSIIKLDDLNWIRPSGGLAPGDESKIIGKIIKKNVFKGEMLLFEDFE